MREVGEIVLCDGGSTDKTREIAARLGVRVLDCESNRGAQMNAGAQISTCDILWFLHADALPPRSGAQRIVAACNGLKPQRQTRHQVLDVYETTVIGGNFRLRFDSHRAASHIFAILARAMRSCGFYYGDSAIWVRRDVFEQLGGFQIWPLFEDYDFARRLEKHARQNGCKTVCIAPPVVVSSRRFGSSTRSSARLLWRWAYLQTLFWLGVAPEKLAQIYRK